MIRCVECGAELKAGAILFVLWDQAGFRKGTFQVTADKLIERFLEIGKDASVKRVEGPILNTYDLGCRWGLRGSPL